MYLERLSVLLQENHLLYYFLRYMETTVIWTLICLYFTMKLLLHELLGEETEKIVKYSKQAKLTTAGAVIDIKYYMSVCHTSN